MSFSRVKPDGWAANEKLTSAQQNQLDIDHAKAVDKTGDTITGNVHVGNAARITVDSGGQIRVDSGGAYNAQSGSNMNFLNGASSTFNVGSTLAMLGSMAFFDGSLYMNSGSSFDVGCLAQFSGNVEFNGSGSLGSILVKVQSGADVRVKTGSRVYFENGSSAYFDTNANIDMLADIAFGTGHTSSYPNGSQIFYQGASTHTSTSVDTYATGSDLIVDNGATMTIKTGSLVTAEASSTIILASSPTMNAGFTASGSSSFISSETLGITSTTTMVGTSNRLKLTARDVTRVLPYRFSRCSPTKWSVDPDVDDNYRVLVAGAVADIDLDLPHGSVIKFVAVSLQIFGVHGAFPIEMPRWTLYRRNLTTTTPTSIASRNLSAASDFSNVIANYTGQLVTMANSVSIGWTVDRTVDQYFLRIWTEGGLNAIAGSQYVGTQLVCSVSEYTEW